MRILIEDLRFKAILGILPKERTTPQNLQIDCIIDYSYEVNNFINYAEVADAIVHTMQDERFELIETALQTVALKLKADFPLIETLDLTIRKPDILPNCTVGVSHQFSFHG